MVNKDQNIINCFKTYNTVSTHHLFVTKTEYDEKLQISGPQQHKQEQQLKKTLPSYLLVLCITICLVQKLSNTLHLHLSYYTIIIPLTLQKKPPKL